MFGFGQPYYPIPKRLFNLNDIDPQKLRAFEKGKERKAEPRQYGMSQIMQLCSITGNKGERQIQETFRRYDKKIHRDHTAIVMVMIHLEEVVAIHLEVVAVPHLEEEMVAIHLKVVAVLHLEAECVCVRPDTCL
jgi:hypothetical protein